MRAGEKLRELINDSKRSRLENNSEVMKYAAQIKGYVSEAEDEEQVSEAYVEIEPVEEKKIGRPRKEEYEKAQKIYPKLTSEKLNYFQKIKSKTTMKIKGDSSRVSYLIEEYKVWDRVRDRYLAHIGNQIDRIDLEIKNGNIPQESSIRLAYDLYQIFGLQLDEVAKYMSKSHFSTLKFCINYIENRRQ